ncbi:hypothetical protein BDP27DRAFT_1533030 [Rhodocollybia butyracea]|uniref:DUF6532 domain-containing protein n=1 Tax=Rhodocollybia butyracea TaxID=206335 RepID=A0A9P5U6H8_9AGAR|nr:hypothetical protein BDP27DRAFT_1533030 [Rhodocollybia butyracea]
MPASTVASQGVKKTQSAAAAAANSGPKTRRATAQAVGPKAPGAKAPSKKEVDLKAFALRQKKEAQKQAQQAKDKVIRQRARAMHAAQCDDEEDNDDNDNATQVFDGLGDRDLDGHGHGQRRVPPLDEEEPGSEDDEDLDGPLDKDSDALLFNETFEGGSSDNEHRKGGHRSNDDDNDDNAVAVAAGDGGDDDMDVDVPSKPCGKITEKHFTPNTRRLAILGKRMNRRATAMKQPFPTDKHAYNMEILQELANEYKGEGDMINVFARVLASVDTQQELVQFLGYARSGFFTNCMAKAREWVPTRFGIPGKMKSTEVKEPVAWLMQDGHYKYGEVNIQNKTYNTQLLFGCEGIAHILRLEVFATKGGANIEIFREIVNARTIAPTKIALMLTFIEHALHEYSEGVYRHVEFSDTARSRYCFHLSSFNCIAVQAPIWAEDFCSSLYKLILTQSNKEFLLDVAADDLTKVDIKGLESNAVATRGASPLPSSSPPCSSPIRA